MIITITGSSAHALKERLRALTSDFIGKYGELGVEKIDAADGTSAERIMESVQSLPFLAQRKLVIIRDLSSNKDAAEKIEQIISSVSDSADVVFYEPALDKRTVTFKVLKSQTDFEQHDELDVSKLAAWLVSEAKKQGGSLSLADANYLVERAGDSQMLLAGELDKLISYSPQISRHSIEILGSHNPRSRIFELIEAAFAGNKARTMKLYEEQRAQKVEPQAILAMIGWQLGLLALVILGKDHSAEQIAKDSGASSYPLSKTQRLAGKISASRLRQIVEDVYRIDRASKTRTIDLDEALKSFLVSL